MVRQRTERGPGAGQNGAVRALLNAVAIATTLWPLGASAQPAPARPDAMMSVLTGEVMGVLAKTAGPAREAELAELVEKRVVPRFDFTAMTRSALGRDWRLASPAQQAELAAQFQTLLVRTYSQALLEFRGQKIEYRPLRAAAADSEVTVRSTLRRSGAEPLTIDYDMADGAAGWQVYDVKLAGVSLVLAYRGSFAAVVRAEGIDGLIRTLREKNAPGAGASLNGATLAPVLMIYGAPRGARP